MATKKKKPQVSEEQQKALVFLRQIMDGDTSGEPPVCPHCKTPFTDFTNVYEIVQNNSCGDCQGWSHLPWLAQEMIASILENTQEASKRSFFQTLRRILHFTPNADKLVMKTP